MADLAEAARAWIGRDGTVSIELPGRWFGRPFDNMHRLTWASSGPHRTILEFDGQLALLLVEPAGIVVDGDVAAITATRIVLDWREYGSGGTYRTEVFDGGDRAAASALTEDPADRVPGPGSERRCTV